MPVFDPKYCTHINVIPAKFGANGSVCPTTPSDAQKYKEINTLRTFNPTLKILIAICASNANWNTAMSSNETRNILASNLVNFTNFHGFDGVDFD